MTGRERERRERARGDGPAGAAGTGRATGVAPAGEDGDGLDLQALRQALPAALAPALERLAARLAAAEARAAGALAERDALFDALPDPASIIAPDGTVLDLNAAGVRAYGRPREAIVGQPIEVLNPDLPPDHMDPVIEALEHGGSYVVEVTNMRGDGSRFPVEVHSGGIDYQGRRCVLAVARDLGRRWQAQTRYRLLLESIDKGVVLFDRQLRVVAANPAAHRILGVGAGPSGPAMHHRDWAIVDAHGALMPEERWPLVRALSSGRIVASTVMGMYHRGSGRMIWVSTTHVPVFSCDCREPDHVFALFTDITELKRDNALFDRAQALAHIGGWEWDRARARLYLTREARRILGHVPPPRDMDGLLACLQADHRQRLQQALDQALRTRRGFELELLGQRGDGHSFWIRMIGEVESSAMAASRIAGTLQDITESRQAEETLRIRACTDPLTGAMNRDAILDTLEVRLGHPAHARLAVLYIDLDRFKLVNDTLGHDAGDQLLVEATRRIAQAIGTDGLLARFGGDEFLVLCDASGQAERPERLAQAIADAFAAPFRLAGEEFRVSASIGIACAPEHGHRPQQLIRNADAAMYEVKRRTRDGWRLFAPELERRQQDRLSIEQHLRQALERGEFHLAYQPQVDLRSGRTVGAEALVRWHSGQLGELRPEVFIRHAESTGDIVHIGTWVLHEACRQARAWRDAGLATPRVAVNVSYRQFAADLVGVVRQALDAHGLAGTALELEFTERVLIEDAPATLRTFAALREMGLALTIDDFGEGYNALNYLRRLPIHGLKLSALFVGGVPSNRSDTAVCEAVCGIARSLGLAVVAEGVESHAQHRYLLELGVPLGQGFLFAPALAPEEFARRLRDAMPQA
ncbi:sensor domain-containing protein [Xanthomonas massiliensis]|uniref:sensor domain-containing protein n=1 Tax=Xanthomonas massiliensis TaxID=1720302 RepID=UPI000824E06C|nr:EAL domain-containing protein [Xanthomonas massiliensis]